MEYTTIEVINNLYNNPNLVYESENEMVYFENGSFRLKLREFRGNGWRESKLTLALWKQTLDKKWTLVQKPVDFMTAINSNKKIKLFEPDKYKFLMEGSCLLNYMSLPTVLDSIHSYGYQKEWQLLNAKWLIED